MSKSPNSVQSNVKSVQDAKKDEELFALRNALKEAQKAKEETDKIIADKDVTIAGLAKQLTQSKDKSNKRKHGEDPDDDDNSNNDDDDDDGDENDYEKSKKAKYMDEKSIKEASSEASQNDDEEPDEVSGEHTDSNTDDEASAKDKLAHEEIEEILKSIDDTKMNKDSDDKKRIDELTNNLSATLNSSAISSLDLSKRKIGNKSAKALAKALRTNNSLKNLNLSNNKITNDGIMALASGLKNNTSLEQLDISHNNIIGSGINELVKLIRCNKSLQFLHLEQNGITEEGLKQLCAACRQNSTLRCLSFLDIEKPENLDLQSINDEIETNCKLMQEQTDTRILDHREVRRSTKELGGGSYGTIIQGSFRNTIVAIKQIKNELSATERHIKNMKKEAEIMLELTHENIVKSYGYYVSPRFSIVMEYTNCGSLHNVLKNKTSVNWSQISWSQIVNLALDIAKGLQYMHNYVHPKDKGIFHRDLKSKNVLIFIERENRLRAKLIDFGFSCHNDSVSASATTIGVHKSGTRNFLAPELRGKDIVAQSHTDKSDIYSYGATLYEMAFPAQFLPPLVIDKKTIDKKNLEDSMFQPLLFSCCKQNPKERADLNNVIMTLEEISTEAEAEFKMGAMYLNGLGVAKNEAKAFEWLEKAAKHGHILAQKNIGFMYIKGLGIQQNNASAFEWFKIAAKNGDANARFAIGSMYYSGQGVDQNMTKAIEWLDRSAKQGHVKAKLKISAIIIALEKTAAQGDAIAQYKLGDMYYYGEGLIQDRSKAFEYYKMAEKKGNSSAQNALGYMYLKGQFVAQILPTALILFKRAAEQGHVKAQGFLKSYHERTNTQAKVPLKITA